MVPFSAEYIFRPMYIRQTRAVSGFAGISKTQKVVQHIRSDMPLRLEPQFSLRRARACRCCCLSVPAVCIWDVLKWTSA